MAAKQGFWLSTYSGKRIYPLDLNEDDFVIEDIAHGLSNACRYAGQSVSFYSVAEHSVRGSIHASNPKVALEFLMHDAAEAYLGDAVKPLTELLSEYNILIDKMQSVINKKFGLPWPMSNECKEIDERMLRTEAEAVFLHNDKWWEQPRYGEPYLNEWKFNKDRARIGIATGSDDVPTAQPIDMQFWPPRLAKRFWLLRFEELTREVAA